jgi:hypothetical protein
VFILYALPIGLLLGLLLGGRVRGLGTINVRYGWVIVLGLLAQVVLFSDPITARIGELGVPIYLASMVAVLAAILANARIPGLPIVALGALSNLVAIAANGGYMPASAEAYAMWGRTVEGFSNAKVIEDPVLWPLTDIIPLPGWLPFTNVISVGDLLIGAGVVVAMVTAMRWARPAPRLPILA